MYQGGLVTFTIKDKESLVAIPLTQVDSEINENGLLLKNKKDGSIIGYFANVVGIEFEEMMHLLGYDFQE